MHAGMARQQGCQEAPMAAADVAHCLVGVAVPGVALQPGAIAEDVGPDSLASGRG